MLSTHLFFQFLRFGIIGLLAALTHYALAMLFIHQQMNIAVANLLGFLTAFWVSYFGHRIFTFNVVQISHRQTLPKFIIVAVTGFVFNETMLIALHHFTPYPISILLIITIIVTALFTFFLNRIFAFKH
jgi:putative flippase GtrA